MRRFRILIALQLFFVFLFTHNILATNYGEGSYGENVYGGFTSLVGNAQAAPCSDIVPGSAPTLVNATALSASGIIISFTAGLNPVTHYALEYGTRPGSYNFSATNIGNSNTGSYTVDMLSPGTTYYFRVRAGNGCATGPWSNEYSAKTFDLNVSEASLEPVESLSLPSSIPHIIVPTPYPGTVTELGINKPSVLNTVLEEKNRFFLILIIVGISGLGVFVIYLILRKKTP